MFSLEVKNLFKTYRAKASKVEALKGVNFSVKKGDFFALLGPNGAGKSTMISILCSLVKKDSGAIMLCGHDFDKNRDEAKSSIGLVPQEFNFSLFETPMEILINQAGYYGIGRNEAEIKAEKYLMLLGIEHKKFAQARMLSGGMKRRLMIARAMMHNPELLILDEPTAGVDIEVRYHIWNFLKDINKKRNITIILTTHYLEEAEQLCNSVAIIDKGLIIKEGGMKEVLDSCNKNCYVATLEKPMKKIPSSKNFIITQQDQDNIVLEFSSSKNISNVIKELDESGVIIKSLSPKSNRLESLFLQLTGKGYE